MKGGIAEVFRIGRAVRPGGGERAQKGLGGIPDPETGLRGEPIQLAQPLRDRFQPGVVQNLGFLRGRKVVGIRLPIMAVPHPEALVPLTAGQQPEPDGFIQQFENELRLGRVRDT